MSQIPAPLPEMMISHLCDLHGYTNPSLLAKMHPVWLAQEHNKLHEGDDQVISVNHSHLEPVRFADWLNDALTHAFPNMMSPAQLEFICHRIEHTLRTNPEMVKGLVGEGVAAKKCRCGCHNGTMKHVGSVQV